MSIQFGELIKGVEKYLKNIFKRKYSAFNIGWLKEKRLKHSKSGKIQSHLYKNTYKVIFKDPKSFLHTVQELFVDEIYKFDTQNSKPVIIDCGAYIGTSILYFKTKYPDSVIKAFEPDKNNFLLLVQNIKNWGFENVNINNQAIWVDNNELYFDEKGEMSGKIHKENSDLSNKTIVKSRRLKDLLIDRVDLLKIDIEGAEYEVLKDCEGSLGNVDKIFIEYHGNYNEMYKLNEILNILVNQNFCYYIKEAGVTYRWPFWEKKTVYDFDVQLNIFAFRDSK
jgi:FkbM family methyltransferase